LRVAKSEYHINLFKIVEIMIDHKDKIDPTRIRNKQAFTQQFEKLKAFYGQNKLHFDFILILY